MNPQTPEAHGAARRGMLHLGTDGHEHGDTGTDGLEQPVVEQDVRSSEVPEDDQPTSVRGVPVVEGDAPTSSGDEPVQRDEPVQADEPVQPDEQVQRDETPQAAEAPPEPGWRPSGLYRTPRSLPRDDPEQRG